MMLRYFNFKKNKFIVILSICFVIYFSSKAISQPSFPDYTIILGIRTISAPVTGYCVAFEKTLREEINNKKIKIATHRILNQYKGEKYSRYFGLLKNSFDPDHVDIECGPNSESSGNLINPKTEKQFSEDIRFIRFYYPTGIKLLIKKDKAEELANLSSIQYEQKISKLKIGVLERTSTLKQFEDNRGFYNYEPIKSDDNQNALEKALSVLDNDGVLGNGTKIDAFASDDLILQSLLKQGITESGEEASKLYVGSRKPYEELGYAVFPSKNYPSINQNDFYLPRLYSENYAIAIKRDSHNESWLFEKIQNSLNTSNILGTRLNKAKNILINPYPDLTTEPESESEPEPESLTPNKWWLPLAITTIPVIGTIITAILNPDLFREIRSWIIRLPTQPENKILFIGVSHSINRKTISEAKVILRTNESQQIKHTDADGICGFTINKSVTEIDLIVQAENYQTYDKPVDISNSGRIISEYVRLSPISEHNL